MGNLIKRFVPAWKVEIEKFFSLVIFNFLFSNGDAHLKNFSLIETQEGDSILSPAYDLINTRLHVNDTDFALDKKLFQDDFQTPIWKKTGHPCVADFIEFGKRIGLNEKRMGKLLLSYTERQPMVDEFINRSFLSEKSKRAYQLHYDTKRNNLNAG
jgi:serine/threonine-protein kinase HipA